MAPSPPPRPSRPSTTQESSAPEVALLLIPIAGGDSFSKGGFLNGDTEDGGRRPPDVGRYPALRPYLAQGWRVEQVAPRLVEGHGLQLFVVLRRDAAMLRQPRTNKRVA